MKIPPRTSYPIEKVVNKILLDYETINTKEEMTLGKLQRLLYYLQGFWLAQFGIPLFDEPLEAWMYGPAIAKVQYRYPNYPRPNRKKRFFFVILDEYSLFLEVLSIYGVFSDSDLSDLSRTEDPWREVETGTGNIISRESMRNYFLSRLTDDDEGGTEE